MADTIWRGDLIASSIAPALGVSILAGAFVGVLVALAFHWVGFLRARWWIPLWLVVGLTYGAFLAMKLGAFEAIGGRHSALGWFALGASAFLGVYLAIIAWLCQPTKARPRGLAASLRWYVAAAIATGLLAMAVLFLVVDARAFPLTYPAAHVALRWASVLSALASLLVASGCIGLGFQRPSRRRREMRIVLGALLLGAVPLVLALDEKDRVTLDALLQRPTAGLAVRTLRQLTDVDLDGYSSVLGGGDCAPFNPNVHPGAEEIPGNGLDDNCMGGDAAVRATYDPSAIVLPSAPAQVSVVIISIDTLRADRMSLYGYHRETTPAIDRWAKSAVRFDRAYTSGPWTSLAMSSMFRGLYPRRLDWTFLWETSRLRLLRPPADDQLLRGERKAKVFATPIDDAHRTLSEWLSLRGMRTEAIVDDGHSQFLEQRLNVSGTWDRFEKASLRGKVRGDASVTSKATRRLAYLADGPPFFLWAHYFGPHDAPTKQDGKPRYGNSRSDKYDHKLHSTDAEVGRFLEAVDEVARERPVAVILTSDHGEEFLSDHRGHGANLKDANVRIPLLVRGPHFGSGSSAVVASLVDVLPTVLAWVDVPLPDGLDGRPLQGLWAERPPEPRIVLSETWGFNRLKNVHLDKIAAVGDSYKLEMNLMDHAAQLRRIGHNGFEMKENLIEDFERPELEAAITGYLDQNRGVKVSR